MPTTISVEENDTIFRIEVPRRGFVCVDALALGSRMRELDLVAGKDPSTEDLATCVADVAYTENGQDVLPDCTRYELASIAQKIMRAMGAAGNVVSSSQSSSPATGVPLKSSAAL